MKILICFINGNDGKIVSQHKTDESKLSGIWFMVYQVGICFYDLMNRFTYLKKDVWLEMLYEQLFCLLVDFLMNILSYIGKFDLI